MILKKIDLEVAHQLKTVDIMAQACAHFTNDKRLAIEQPFVVLKFRYILLRKWIENLS